MMKANSDIITKYTLKEGNLHMARPKGSKNRTTTISMDEQIISITADISSLSEKLKTKKAELRKLQKNKANADKTRLLDAIASSGKSYDEIVSLLATH